MLALVGTQADVYDVAVWRVCWVAGHQFEAGSAVPIWNAVEALSDGRSKVGPAGVRGSSDAVCGEVTASVVAYVFRAHSFHT